MGSIKSRSKLYELEVGDYIMDNGSCLQYIPKNNKKLPWSGYSHPTSVLVSKSELKRYLKEYKIREVKKSTEYSELTVYVYLGDKLDKL